MGVRRGPDSRDIEALRRAIADCRARVYEHTDETANNSYTEAHPSPLENVMQIGASEIVGEMTPKLVKATYFSSQAGAPSGTPTAIGLFNMNESNGDLYKSTGTTDSGDWELVGGGGSSAYRETANIWATSAGALTNAASGRGCSIILPAMTITRVAVAVAGWRASDDTNYWKIDAGTISSAGGTTPTALASTPDTTKTTGGLYTGTPARSKVFDLAVDQNLTVTADTTLLLLFTLFGSATAPTYKNVALIVEGTLT
ncbi:MAG: hypothetical protein GY753_06855 [Gammaproteobacteria bacterium]|nr:hypothetical protein [Gammaproteobacteria bacterium]